MNIIWLTNCQTIIKQKSLKATGIQPTNYPRTGSFMHLTIGIFTCQDLKSGRNQVTLSGELKIRNSRFTFQNLSSKINMIHPCNIKAIPLFSKERDSNLGFGMRIQKHLSQRIQQSVNIVSKRLGIGKELHPRTPDQLSAGQKQVVGIGRAITIQPKILLLDEPLAHVDPRKRLQLRRELKDYHQSMDTISLYVTHNLSDAFSLADRLAIMNEGKIIQVDTPQNIRENPVDDFVKDFMDCFEL